MQKHSDAINGFSLDLVRGICDKSCFMDLFWFIQTLRNTYFTELPLKCKDFLQLLKLFRNWELLIAHCGCLYIIRTSNFMKQVLSEKMIVSQLAKKFSAFYGIGRFIAMFTKAHCFSLSRAQSRSHFPTLFLKSILMLSFYLCLGLVSTLFPLGFPTVECLWFKYSVIPSFIPHAHKVKNKQPVLSLETSDADQHVTAVDASSRHTSVHFVFIGHVIAVS